MTSRRLIVPSTTTRFVVETVVLVDARLAPVADLAEYLLENILERENPRVGSVLVDDDDEMLVGRDELAEEIADPLALRNEDRGAQDVARAVTRSSRENRSRSFAKSTPTIESPVPSRERHAAEASRLDPAIASLSGVSTSRANTSWRGVCTSRAVISLKRKRFVSTSFSNSPNSPSRCPSSTAVASSRAPYATRLSPRDLPRSLDRVVGDRAENDAHGGEDDHEDA